MTLRSIAVAAPAFVCAACSSTIRLYEGAPRPPAEIAKVETRGELAPPEPPCQPYVKTIDGLDLADASTKEMTLADVVEIVPGDHVAEVLCYVRWPRADPRAAGAMTGLSPGAFGGGAIDHMIWDHEFTYDATHPAEHDSYAAKDGFRWRTLRFTALAGRTYTARWRRVEHGQGTLPDFPAWEMVIAEK